MTLSPVEGKAGAAAEPVVRIAAVLAVVAIALVGFWASYVWAGLLAAVVMLTFAVLRAVPGPLSEIVAVRSKPIDLGVGLTMAVGLAVLALWI